MINYAARSTYLNLHISLGLVNSENRTKNRIYDLYHLVLFSCKEKELTRRKQFLCRLFRFLTGLEKLENLLIYSVNFFYLAQVLLTHFPNSPSSPSFPSSPRMLMKVWIETWVKELISEFCRIQVSIQY